MIQQNIYLKDFIITIIIVRSLDFGITTGYNFSIYLNHLNAYIGCILIIQIIYAHITHSLTHVSILSKFYKG
jgi:hypothetical protein